MLLDNALETRGNGIIIAGGNAAFVYTGGLLGVNEAAALPPASLIITPQGVQVKLAGGLVKNVVSPDIFSHRAIFRAVPISGDTFDFNVAWDMPIELVYSSLPDIRISQDTGDIILPAGKYIIKVSWLGGGKFVLEDENTHAELVKFYGPPQNENNFSLSPGIAYLELTAETVVCASYTPESPPDDDRNEFEVSFDAPISLCYMEVQYAIA